MLISFISCFKSCLPDFVTMHNGITFFEKIHMFFTFWNSFFDTSVAVMGKILKTCKKLIQKSFCIMVVIIVRYGQVPK